MKSITYMFKPLIEEVGRINQKIKGIDIIGSIDTVSNLHYVNNLKEFEGVNYYVDNVSVVQVTDIVSDGIIKISLCLDTEVGDGFGYGDDCFRAVENVVELIKNLLLEYGLEVEDVVSDMLGEYVVILRELVDRHIIIPIEYGVKTFNHSIE